MKLRETIKRRKSFRGRERLVKDTKAEKRFLKQGLIRKKISYKTYIEKKINKN